MNEALKLYLRTVIGNLEYALKNYGHLREGEPERPVVQGRLAAYKDVWYWGTGAAWQEEDDPYAS